MNNYLTLLSDSINSSVSNSEQLSAGAAGAIIVLIAFASVLVITCIVFWVSALIHVIQHEDVKDRTLWLVILLVVGSIVGPIYYFAVQKPYQQKSKNSPNTDNQIN